MAYGHSLILSLSVTNISIFKKIFGRKQKSKDMPMSEAVMFDVIKKYGEVLKAKDSTPTHLSDENKLPYSKEQIKDAIRFALIVSEDSETIERLKASFMKLVMWQKGVGKKDIIYPFNLNDKLVDITDQQWKLAEVIAEKWGTIIVEEIKELREELQLCDILASEHKRDISIKSRYY